MCGIVGAFKRKAGADLQTEPGVAGRMLGAIRHRGPDEQRDWRAPDGNCWLATARLAIIDVAEGHQPMSNEDGSIWVAFNGQIYNHVELHRELAALGHTFRTHCDTEVLVHGYEAWGGPGLLQRLRGMYAFAIYDMKRRRLFAARDRVGIKPFFWWTDGSIFLFASEVKCLLAHPRLASRRVEPRAVSQFLVTRYIPAPLTAFKDVHKLPPGHYVEIALDAPDAITPQRYWDISLKPHRPEPTWDEALTEVDRLLCESVRLRLMSEVPLGAQLSGGVDSSLIVAYMDQLRREAGTAERIKTFSVGFDAQGFSELPYARAVAERYGTEHHEIHVGFQDFVDEFARLSWIYDEPVGEAPAIPTYLMCRRAKQHVTVMLCGEGADEIFGGYSKFAFDGYSRFLDWMPDGLRKGAIRGAASLLPFKARRYRGVLEVLALGNQVERYASWQGAFDTSLLPQLLDPAFSGPLREEGIVSRVEQELARCDSDGRLERLLWSDFHLRLADDMLVKGDRMSMGASVEARVPFLDHVLVEYASGLPAHYKVRGLKTKVLLKKLAERYVPMENIYRPKVGFTVPLSDWFLGPLRGFLRDTLLDDRCLSRGYFVPDVLKRVVEEHLDRKVYREQGIWALLSLEIWHRLFVDDDGSQAACERLQERIRASLPAASAVA
jgi:asparagine synthase (glutamine-hydrolysing)